MRGPALFDERRKGVLFRLTASCPDRMLRIDGHVRIRGFCVLCKHLLYSIRHSRSADAKRLGPKQQQNNNIKQIATSNTRTTFASEDALAHQARARVLPEAFRARFVSAPRRRAGSREAGGREADDNDN